MRDRDDEMAEEMRSHIEHRIDQLIAQGVPAAEARASALRQFGNVEQMKLIAREQRRTWRIEAIARDIRFGLRRLRRSPGFAVTAIVTLALGVGANVAAFSLVRAVLLNNPAIPDVERVVTIDLRYDKALPQGLNLDDVAAIRENVPGFSSTAGAIWAESTIRGNGDSSRASTNRVSEDFFELFGVRAAVGRTLGRADFADGSAAVISDATWRHEFGGEPDVLGRTIHVDTKSFVVVGVMPPDFVQEPGSGSAVSVWTPFIRESTDLRHGNVHAVARLRPGIEISAAIAQVNLVMTPRTPATLLFPGNFTINYVGAGVVPLGKEQAARIAPGVLLLQGTAAFLLFITCANLANVFLAEASARAREFGVRAALGAGRARLVGQLVTESAVVATIGGILGVIVAALVVPALVATAGNLLPLGSVVSINLPELGFGMALGLITAVVFAGIPAWLVARADPLKSIRGATGATSGRGVRTFRASLVTIQVLLALVVLTGTGLLGRSFARVMAQPVGFEPGGLVTGEVTLPASDRWIEQSRSFVERAENELRARLPGASIAVTGDAPFNASTSTRTWTYFSPDSSAPGRDDSISSRSVAPALMEMLRVRLIRGRALLKSDNASAPAVAVVNESFARRYGKGGEVIGGRLEAESSSSRDSVTIVGVIADTRDVRISLQPRAVMYRPIDQAPTTRIAMAVGGVSARVAGEAMRAAVRAIDPDVPVTNVGAIADKISIGERTRRFYLMMIGVFGAIALAVAAVGVYAVVSHVATQRRREMGIRLALGARPSRISTLVVGHGLRPVLAGLVGGVLVAWWLGRLLQTNAIFKAQLFEMTAHDITTFISATLTLLLVAVVACVLPARRAASTNVTAVLKNE